MRHRITAILHVYCIHLCDITWHKYFLSINQDTSNELAIPHLLSVPRCILSRPDKRFLIHSRLANIITFHVHEICIRYLICGYIDTSYASRSTHTYHLTESFLLLTGSAFYSRWWLVAYCFEHRPLVKRTHNIRCKKHLHNNYIDKIEKFMKQLTL